ncbi:phosphate/phosphite/phosphonate ABC transporter substrate-binding protein [Nocardioides marinus]|nr:phosphate/phosphite/phosphonate ABC transporter substrate-binding protein [Nocardioides marinus]
MIAYLGMYDRPETAAANDRLWALIRAHLGTGPEQLTRETDGDPWRIWTSPQLLLAQTCGCPYRTRLYGEVELVATPDHGLPGCAPGFYNSVFVARAERSGQPVSAFDGATFAYNDGLSQSGWAAPMIHLHDRGLLPGALLATGGHQQSARAVAEGRADFAALDVVSWQIIREHDAFAASLCEIDQTAPSPALPYITAVGTNPNPLFSALESAIAELGEADRQTLRLQGLVRFTPSDYLAVPTPPGPVLTEQRIRQGSRA